VLLQESAEAGGRYIDGTLIAALIANGIAVIALFKDAIASRLTRASIDFYDVGALSVYFGVNGLVVEIVGTIHALNADQFVRSLKVTVTRDRDSSRHDFVWRSSRVTCPPKTGPQRMRVLDGNWSQGGQDAWQPVYAGADC
jgi:hypothetical protein